MNCFIFCLYATRNASIDYIRGRQFANLAREGKTIGPRSSAKMLKKFITFSLKFIFCI